MPPVDPPRFPLSQSRHSAARLCESGQRTRAAGLFRYCALRDRDCRHCDMPGGVSQKHPARI